MRACVLPSLAGFLGGAIMVLDAGSNDTGVTVIGDAVSFLGAVSMAVYLAVGGVMRNWMPLFLYAFPVTLAASVVATATSAAVEGTTLLGTDGDAAFGWLFNTEWVLLVLYQGFGPGSSRVCWRRAQREVRNDVVSSCNGVVACAPL